MTKPSIIRGRRWLCVAIAGVTLAGSISLTAGTGWAEENVVIPDVQFQNCLDRNLGKDEGEGITATELASIIQLNCDEAGIVDLAGAKYLSNVEELYLSGNSITSLDGLDGLEPVKDPLAINLSSNKISDLSPLKKFTDSVVYADGQKWDLAVVVDKATTVKIIGRSGEPITQLTPAWEWSSLTIVGAKIHASEAGLVDLDFADPQQCSASTDCTGTEYTFNGTVSVTAAEQFTSTPAPTISGKAAIGETLTAQVSDWSPLQLDWAYQWFRDGMEIADATTSTYTVTADDAGSTLLVAVTGILDGYASTVASQPVRVGAPEFTTTPAPTISGTAAIGSTLTAHVSGWSPTPEGWDYQWYRNDTLIAGAISSTYIVSVYDAGSTLKVAVTGEKSGYADATATSASTAKVAGNPFGTTNRPKITGTTTVGRTLTAVVSGWSPTPESWTYQWYHDGAGISGATESTYLLAGSDAGKRITVTVTGFRAGNNPAIQTSSSTRKVSVGSFHTAAPIIAGTVQVGHTLTATAPGWLPTADHWSYRWYRNNRSISHATASSYTLVGSDARTKITVRMTASKTGYYTAGRTSAATGKVASGQFSATPPTITGSPEVGSTLTVVISGWSPTPSTVHRQWYRDGSTISHATQTTYRVIASDLGHTITARVTGELNGYTSVTITSAGLQITE